MLVSSSELDPHALELLRSLVECRIEAGDCIVLLSGWVRDPNTTDQLAVSRQTAVVELHGLLRRYADTVGRPQREPILGSQRPAMLLSKSVSDRRAPRKPEPHEYLAQRRTTCLLLC